MGIPSGFKLNEIPQGFKEFTWGKPPGVKNCGDAASIRSEETGYTIVKMQLRPDEVERIKESGEVYLVLCSPHYSPIPPFWVGAHQRDAIRIAREPLR